MMRFCLTLLIIALTALTGCSSQTHLSEERSDSPLMSVFETPSVVVPSDLKETVWGNPELLFFRKIATESRADENGWVYQFIYEDYKTDELDNSHILSWESIFAIASMICTLSRWSVRYHNTNTMRKLLHPLCFLDLPMKKNEKTPE